ncbi:MAG TPA: PadR family transcriptional regulator [Vicinamibacterales bacterium]|nr:PadR family transcriptional regulator [Vicinamibacterales bacterium]
MRRLSIPALSVLHALSGDVRYGFHVIDATGLPSGTVYPVLSRLERDGLVKSTWEEESDAHAAGRPARRYYKVTPAGEKALREATAQYQALVPAFGRKK